MSGYSMRDLAGEATEQDAYRARLRADISVEEANDEMDERNYEDVDWLTPSEYELEAYYADQDSQVAAYRA